MKTLYILLLTAAYALGEDLYITQTAQGTGSGNSAANAKAYTFFNTAGSWTTATGTDGLIGPGDTVHIVGTITNPLTFQGSGTAGNRITLKFDAGGKLRHPTSFGTGMITSGAGLHDVTIEGGNPTPVKTSTTQVDIEIFDNGTFLGNQQDSNRAIFIDVAGSDITIKNLYIWGLYVREFASNTDVHASGNSISLRGNDNLVIDNCAFQHAEAGPGITGIGAQNDGIRITNNLCLDTSTAIKLGCAGAPCVNMNPVITGNRLDGFDRWGGILPGGGHHHSDGIQTITVTDGQRQQGIIVAYNEIGPHIYNDGHMNAHIFLEDRINGAKVYNNILTVASPDYTINMAITVQTFSAFFGQPFFEQCLIVNNSIIRYGAFGPDKVGMGMAIENGNIANNYVQGMTYVNLDTYISGYGDNYCNFNRYFGGGTNAIFGTRGFEQHIFNSGEAWIANTPYDDNSQPFFTTPLGLTSILPPLNLTPAAGSTLINTGINVVNGVDLTTIFTDDFYGNPRVGNYDIGAVEFVAGGPTPPMVVSSAINAAGTQFSVTMSRDCVFGSGGNGGMTVTSTGGPVTLGTNPTIAGAVITWPITNRLIGQVESLSRAYAQPGSGIEAADDQTDLSSFPNVAITNNSTVGQAASPVFSPVPGAYSTPQNVSMTSPGATIRYTIDGTDPTAASLLYSTPIVTSLNTTYRARAFIGGSLDSPIAIGAYTIGDFVFAGSWTNIAIAPQTGIFTWSFRAASSVAPNDGVLGLADHNATGFTDLGVIMRFAPEGVIDARNGGTYIAENVFPYVAGQAYDFVFTINVTTHTYSMTVVQAGGSTPTVIANNFAFRNEQNTVIDLDVFAGLSTPGQITVSNMLFSTGILPSPGIGTVNVQNLRIGP